jgi:ABC-2 type transport system ATP-binding protein
VSVIAPLSDETPQTVRDGLPAATAYRPGQLEALHALAAGTEDALVVEHLVKRFEKEHDLFASLKQRFLRRDPAVADRPKVVRAVDDVSLRIGRREIYGVLGSNGSGKSTLIRVISTLLLPDSGSVRVFGHDVVREELAVQRMINRVSVEAAFFRKLSPMENLIYSARLYNLDIAAAKAQIRTMLGQLGIKPDRYDQPLENMSRGMQQKVAIARAFLTAPVLLLLDEPTTGLDPRSKQDVQQFVADLRATHDATVLLTTHDMDEAEALCDRIAIIDGGAIVAEDTPAGLQARVGATMGLPGPATMNEVFLHYTGRDWEADENDEEDAE